MAPRRNGSDKSKHGNGRRNGRRPVFDHAAAFAYFAALGVEERTFRRVAAEFHVHEKTVGKWAALEGWEAKAAAMDAEAARRTLQKVVRDLAERDADTLRLIDAYRVSLLDEGEIKAMTPYERARIFARLVGHEQLIEGKATDRITFTEAQQLQDGFIAFIADLAVALERGDVQSSDEIVERLRDHMEQTFGRDAA